MKKIVILETDNELVSRLSKELKHLNLQLDTCQTFQEFAARFECQAYEAAVVSYSFSAFRDYISDKNSTNIISNIPIIILSKPDQQNESIKLLKQGIYDYLLKPVNLPELLNKIQQAVEKKRLRELNAQLARQNSQLITLNSLIFNINQLSDLPDVLKASVNSVIKFEICDICLIHYWEHPKAELKYAGGHGLEEQAKDVLKKYKKSNYQWWQRLKKQKTVIISEGEVETLDHPFMQTSFRQVIYLPISFKKRLLGIITLANKTALQLSSDEYALLDHFRLQVGLAVEHIRLRKEQEKKSKEIQARNHELKSFIYTVSHDLKSPLVALYGFADLLKEGYSKHLDDIGQDYLNRILMNSELMHQMIDDLLELSRIDRVLGPRSKFSTHRLMEELAAIFEYQMRKKGVTLEFPKKMPIIYADRERIGTVFQNLLTNAIKFTHQSSEPKISVNWKVQEEEYVFWIQDNGTGIEPQHKKRIFDLFQRFGGEQNKGTGIGLTITRKIVEHHGGKIWVESEVNQGTTFYFTVPKHSRVLR